MSDLAYARFDADRDSVAVARLLHFAFAGTIEGCEAWIRKSGPEHVRVLRAPDGSTPACLLRVPMGQFFGGRSVRHVGIAGVAVDPALRGRRLGQTLMTEAVREIASEGVAISGLYASTQALYRLVGYEQGGYHCVHQVPVSAISARGGVHNVATGSVRELTDADLPAIQACYRAYATLHDGPLERGSYVWNRIREARDKRYTAFGFFERDELVGYVYLMQNRKPDTGRQDIELSDIAFRTPEAGRRILAFFAGFSMMADAVMMTGGPYHPLASLLPLQSFTARLKELWMTRITHVPSAIESRGYAADAGITLRLRVRDDVVAENDGEWLIRVEGGRGEASRVSPESGSSRASVAAVPGAAAPGAALPSASLHVRALAPLYTGFVSAAQARLLGWIDADDAGVQALSRVFPQGVPWMSDFY